MTLRERIRYIVSEYGISVREFEKTSGLKRGNISNMTGSLGSDKVAKIIAAYPDINIFWFLSGEGEPFLPESGSAKNPIAEGRRFRRNKPGRRSAAAGMVSDSARQEYSAGGWVGESDDEFVDLPALPLYEIDYLAGLSVLFAADAHPRPLSYVSLPNLPKCDGAIYVRGDSIAPILSNGDIAVYKIVRDFSHIVFGELYIISFLVDDSEYITVKYVNRGDAAKDVLVLSGLGDSSSVMEVPLSSVKALAMVKASIRFNTMG